MINPKLQLDVAQLRRLHRWLSYNRYTIFIYGGGLYLLVPTLLVLIVLAIVFAPYMLFVLYKNGKRGWLIFFGVLVGIPTVLAFSSTDNIVLSTLLHYLPLLTFYFYCFLLRLSVDDWVSDSSSVVQSLIDSHDRQNRPEE